MAERAMSLMVERALHRKAFGRHLLDHGMVQKQIALSRIEIEQARLLVLECARRVDDLGTKAAFQHVAMIKYIAPNVACRVIDRAIQIHGAAGVSQDSVLWRLYCGQRALRIADGPDEVHLVSVAKYEANRNRAKVKSRL